MMKTIVVDDEPAARNVLIHLLNEHCEGKVEVVDQCANVVDAVQSINTHKPDLVFLDIEMPGINGLQLSQMYKSNDFKVVFTTAYSEYAVKAFSVSAAGYLLKPIDVDELIGTVDRIYNQHQEEIRKSISTAEKITKIALPVADGHVLVDIDEIIYIQADGSYSIVMLKGGEQLLISKKLGEFELILKNHIGFFRCHRSYIIALNQITQYIKSDGGLVVLNKMYKIPISREKKEEFQGIIDKIKI